MFRPSFPICFPARLSKTRCWDCGGGKREEGAGFGWFWVTPGIFAHEPPRTFENDPALWAYLKTAKAYVVNDPAFGLVGFGCTLKSTPETIKVRPTDGLKKRIMFVDEKIAIEATTGEINTVTLNRADRSLDLQIGDSTGLVTLAQLTIQGLPAGRYKVTGKYGSRLISVSDKLELSIPIAEAETLKIQND